MENSRNLHTPRQFDVGEQKSRTTHGAKSADALTERNIQKIVGLEQAAKASRSFGERFATHVATFCGNMTFVWFHFLAFSGWILYNTSSFFTFHPDPPPFTFLALTVSVEAIFLSSFILISQSRETRLTEQRSQLDLQLNLLIEQENTKMLKMLKSIAVKVGADFDGDADLAALEESTHPERLLDQIEKATANHRADA